jgi:hypothetical protein
MYLYLVKNISLSEQIHYIYLPVVRVRPQNFLLFKSDKAFLNMFVGLLKVYSKSKYTCSWKQSSAVLQALERTSTTTVKSKKSLLGNLFLEKLLYIILKNFSSKLSVCRNNQQVKNIIYII